MALSAHLAVRRAARSPTDAHRHVSTLSSRLERAVLALALVGFGVTAVDGLLRAAVTPGGRAAGVVVVLALLAVQLRFSLARPPPRPVRVGVLLAEAGLIALAAAFGAPPWPGVPGFLVGSLLVALPARLAWPGSAVVVAAVVGLQVRVGPVDPARIAFAAAGTAITGLVVWGVTTVPRKVADLCAAQAEVERAAAARERVRMARDVHDLLGMSLSAITLKCELTARLLPDDAEQSRSQLGEVLAMARRALADVRTVARCAGTLALDEEIALAQDMLIAVDIRVVLELDGPAPGPAAGAVLAMVLREGVTNVLRHSTAKWCRIALRHGDGTVRLEIDNDGVPPGPAETTEDGGHGLRSLTLRVAVLGGVVAAERDPPLHRLRATIPAPA